MTKEKKNKKEVISKEDTNKTSSILKKVGEHIPWIATLLSLFTIAILSILNFFEFILSFTKFKYLGIDYGLYNFNEGNIFHLVISYILTAITTFSIFLIIKDFKKLNIKKKISKSLLILLFNSFIIIIQTNNENFNSLIILNVLLILVEYLLSKVIFINIDDVKDSEKFYIKEALIDLFEYFVFCIIIIIFCLSIYSYFQLKSENQFKIINQKTVIVYSTKDYYLVLDCKVEKDELTIYKGRQTKINNDNIRSELIEFKKVTYK